MSKTGIPICLAIVLLLMPGSDRMAMAQDDAPDTGPYCATEAEAKMLQRINTFREENGLDPLVLSQPLGAAASLKAGDMAEQDYLTHSSPDGQGLEGLLEEVGYTFNTTIGENIAAGQEGADATFEQWVNSPEHREIMLGEEFTAVGIGRAHNAEAEYDWYWAAEFGGEVDEAAEVCDNATPEATPAS